MNQMESARPVHIEDPENASSASERIASGRAYLRVTAYPWGVEFDVCDGGSLG